jgi:hypothetical protein
MDEESDIVKADELKKLTRKVYWTAAVAILLGVPVVVFANAFSPGTWHSLCVGGIILGVISLILATTARTTATTVWKSRMRISFTMANIGLLLA